MRSPMGLQALGILVGCIVTVASAGCASRTPYLDTQFGQAVRQLKAQQTLNPQAATNADPGVGVDAQAANSGYDLYQKSYRAPEPTPSAFIGIGGANGSR